MWLLIIGAIILIIALSIRNSSKTARLNQEKNLPLIQETISKLKILEQYSHLPFIEEECGLVMIIPVNSEGDLYSPRSDRLKISLLLYNHDMNIISSYEPRTDIASSFQLIEEDNSLFYISITYSTLFGEYRQFMPLLDVAIKKAFPNVEFEFDGSRVMTKHL